MACWPGRAIGDVLQGLCLQPVAARATWETLAALQPLWPCLPMVPEVSRLRGLLEDPAPLHFRRKISGNPAPRPGMQLPRAPASPLRFPRVIHPGSTQGVPFEDIPAYETALPEDTACAYQSAPLPLAARL